MVLTITGNTTFVLSRNSKKMVLTITLHLYLKGTHRKMVLTIALHLYLQGTHRKIVLTITLHLYLQGILIIFPVVVCIVVIGTGITAWIVCICIFTAASATVHTTIVIIVTNVVMTIRSINTFCNESMRNYVKIGKIN